MRRARSCKATETSRRASSSKATVEERRASPWEATGEARRARREKATDSQRRARREKATDSQRRARNIKDWRFENGNVYWWPRLLGTGSGRMDCCRGASSDNAKAWRSQSRTLPSLRCLSDAAGIHSSHTDSGSWHVATHYPGNDQRSGYFLVLDIRPHQGCHPPGGNHLPCLRLLDKI